MTGTRTRAVVVGAGMAGLMAARALSDVVDDVVLLERERIGTRGDETVGPRGHVPQGQHIHVLLSAGLTELVAWFPGIAGELIGHGAVPVDGNLVWFHHLDGYRKQGDWDSRVLSMTRPLLELVVRERVRGLANVTIEDGVRVEGVALEGEPGTRRVSGVVVDGAVRPADLVVDCSGRSSRLLHGLEQSGDLVPPVTRLELDIGYATRFLRRRPGDLDGAVLVSGPAPPRTYRSAAVVAVEGDRWQVTLSAMHGDVPPTDDAGFLAFARSVASPAVGQLVAGCEPLSDAVAYRYPSAQRRHVERTRSLPGLVLLGDSACSFDPVYGQGMTSGALQARTLTAVVRRRGVRDPDLATAYHRRAAKVIDGPWSIALGADFVHPETTGDKPFGTDLSNAYSTRVVRASHTSLPVARTLNRVLNLAAPPSTLLRPDVVARVLLGASRSPSVGGRPQPQPVVGAGSGRSAAGE